MQINSHKSFQVSLLLFCLLLSVEIYAQTPEKQTNEEKRQAEQERKDREKQAKEDAKRQRENAKAQTLLEKLIPVGTDVNYDRFKDITTVNTKGMIVYPMDRDIRFEIAYVGMWSLYSVQGQFGSAPPSVRFFLHGQTLLIGTPSNPCSLSMILNGTERVQFGQMSYGSTIQLGNIAWVDMSLNSFRTLATSKSIDVQSCRFETSLNPRHISGLAKLLEGLPAVTAEANTSQTPIEPLHPLVGSWKFQVARGGVAEDWLLRIEKDGSVIRGSVKTPTAEIALPNIISIGNMFSGSASEFVPGGLNMMTFSGEVSNNAMSGKLTIYLAGQQQPIVPFEAKRTSIP